MALSNDDFKVNLITKDFTVKTFDIPGAPLRTQIEYPSEWFAKNRGLKPPVRIPKNDHSKEIWNKILGSCGTGATDCRVVLRHMYEYMTENYRETLSKRWASYNVVIGEQGAMVNPATLLDVRILNEAWTYPEGPETTEKQRQLLFIKFLMGYRYGLASDAFTGYYKNTVLKKMNTVIKDEHFNFKDDVNPGDIAMYRNWYNNAEFKALIAALDMFWFKFPDSPGAKLRVCTLNARFKYCSSLSELRHLSSIANLRIGDALKYVFSVQIGAEMESIGRGGEEIRQEDSYFPYMRELRLSRKSPYSSSANVNIHNWISFFCALLGSTRSFNARVVSESGLMHSLNLALFAARAFKNYVSPSFVFGGAKEAEEAKALNEIGTNSEDALTIDPSSSLGVYMYMNECKNTVPTELLSIFEQPFYLYL